MLLAIDVRNREIIVGIRPLERPGTPKPGLSRAAGAESDRGGGWLALRRLGAIAERSADEYAFFLREIAREIARETPREAGPFAIDSAWLSSVVPAMTGRLAEAVRTAFGVTCSIVGPGTKTGVKIRTDIPSEVGADLVCAAAAARELAGGPCIVVDFGTALSLSAVSGAGEFLGCAIAPGITAAAESLRLSTAQIPDVRLDPPARAIGRNTAQAVQAGILLGFGGLVDRLIGLMRAEMAPNLAGSGATEEALRAAAESVAVLGTGDRSGKALLSSLGYDRFVPDLALEGLAIIAARAEA